MSLNRPLTLFGLAATLLGATALTPPSTFAAKAAQEKAICAVCGPREGAGPEPVRATATYKGVSYAFCSVDCKVAFLKDPNEFLVTDSGKPAPAFALKDFQGRPVSLADYKGKVVLADFWATHCVPCVKALPELQALHAKYGPKGFAVLGLTVDEKAAPVEKAVKRAKVAYPILMANPKVWNAYRVSALPSLVLIGRDGRIVRRYGGEADKAAMEAEIRKALEAKIEPEPNGKTEAKQAG